MIREIMKGIRIVKCYAWEAAMEARPPATFCFFLASAC